MPWPNRFYGGKYTSRTNASLRALVRLERCEERLAPIVGAFAELTAIAPLAPFQPPSPYDGVVRIETAGSTGFSGSLIRTGSLTQTGPSWGYGHQILTVAHNIATGPLADPGGSALTVRFDLARGPAANSLPYPITINVPNNVAGGAQYQVQHSLFGGNLNDIGLLVLADQVSPAPDRLLVAPFKAQQYTLYGGNPTEVQQQFTMVGYGRSGTGANGANKPGGTKRAGQNRFDSSGTPYNPAYTMYLLYDFDRLNAPGGLPNIDPIGSLYQNFNAGLGAAEAMHAPGDSGGPAFVGANVIAGVLSSIISPGPPDITAGTNSTFGELGFVTNVSQTIGDAALQGVLNPAGGPAYHLVLDMNYQVYGRSNPAGGGADALTIHAKVVGGFLEIHVNKTDNPDDLTLNGVYYRAPVANIKGLTIRGTDDNETIIIESLLGLRDNGPITVEARGGNDTIKIIRPDGPTANDYMGNIYVHGDGGQDFLWVDNSVSPHAFTAHTFAAGPAGWPAALYRNVGPTEAAATSRPVIHIDNVEEHRLSTGAGTDVVQVDKGPAHGTTILTHDGNDRVAVGSPTTGLANVAGLVYVDLGSGDADEMWFRDAANGANTAYTLARSDLGPTWEYSLYRATGGVNSQTLHFKQADKITLDTGSGGNVVQVYSVPDISVGTYVNTNGGGDTIHVGSLVTIPNREPGGLAGVLGKVFIDAGNNAGDHVLFEDALSTGIDNQYTLSVNPTPVWHEYRLDRYWNGALRPSINVRGAKKYTLNAGPNADLITVQATPATATDGVFINGNDGNDTITVGPHAAAGLDGLANPVTVHGNAGDNTLVVDNRGAATRNLTVTKTAVTRSDGKTINYTGITKTVKVTTDGGAANINLQEKAKGVAYEVSFEGGAGGDTGVIGAGVFGFEVGNDPNGITVSGVLRAGDQVTVGGTLNVTLDPTWTPTVGEVYVVVNNKTDAPLVGTFDDLPEGAIISLGGWSFQISYVGSAGDRFTNDVTLTVI